jgi:hypothetical protein
MTFKLIQMTEEEKIAADVADAQKALEDFIESQEPMRKNQALLLQSKVDRRLARMGNQNNRLTEIYALMLESFLELNDTFQEFSKMNGKTEE